MLNGNQLGDDVKFIAIQDKDFEIMDAPMMQSEWQEIMGNNPSYFADHVNSLERPVEQVSWNDCQEFIEKLNAKQDGYIYRLPTEEEWEFCCRAGSNINYCFGDDVNQLKDYAWYSKNSENSTHPVKQKKPNAFGLYDMHGNVWEWTSNLRGENSPYYVLRGGSWDFNAQFLRSAYRINYSPGFRYGGIGFRLVRTVGNSLQSYPLTLDQKALRLAVAKAQAAIDEIKSLLGD